jgi:hypothetical protein
LFESLYRLNHKGNFLSTSVRPIVDSRRCPCVAAVGPMVSSLSRNLGSHTPIKDAGHLLKAEEGFTTANYQRTLPGTRVVVCSGVCR